MHRAGRGTHPGHRRTEVAHQRGTLPCVIGGPCAAGLRRSAGSDRRSRRRRRREGRQAPAPDRASHTVDEYRSDAKLRELTFARCAKDPASRDVLPDCINAREAERLEGVGSLRKLAPLELPIPPRTDSPQQELKQKD